MPQIVMIACYMSGDRNTIASALHLEPNNLCVCVYGPQSDPRTDDLHRFFTAKFRNTPKKIRVGLYYVLSREETERINSVVKRPKEHRDAFGEVVDAMALCFNVARNTISLNIPSVATTTVGEHFRKKHAQTRDKLRELWGMPQLANRFDAFLELLGFREDGRYAFLWCKTGDMKAEKAHHYTDPHTWQALILGLSSTEWTPVLVGDDLGLATQPSLVKFWKLWQQLFNEDMERDVQQAFWAHVATVLGDRCCAIGMRSGMLEVPALLGIRTLYLEEAENAQQNRMAAWLLKMDSWYRGVLPRVGGLPQLGYQLRDMNEAPRSFPLTVRSAGGDLGRVIGNLEKGVKLRIALVCYRMLELTPLHGAQVPRSVINRIFDFLDLDIRDPRYALAQISVENIVLWVRDPGRCVTKSEKYEKVAEEAIRLGMVQIQGGLAPTRQQVGGGRRGASTSTALTLAPSRGMVTPLRIAQPLQQSMGSGSGPVGPMPRMDPPGRGQLVPYSPPFESAARSEFDQLCRLIRNVDNTTRVYYLILERIYHLHTKYRFK